MRRDLFAGVAVFFVSVPLCLGIAHASGAPLLAGIITAILGGLVVGALSSSQVAVSGPAAGLTAVSVWGLGLLGSFEMFLSAVFVAGVIQLLFAFGHVSAIARMMPSSVVRGMVSAIGALLIIRQLPHMLGIDTDAFAEDEFAVARLADVEITALVIGVICFAVVLLWERFVQRVPSALAAVGVGIGLDALVRAYWPSRALGEVHMVHVPHLDGVSSFFAATARPALAARPEILYVAAVIAAVASLESLLSLDAIDRLDPLRRKTSARRELLAQGAGNALAGLMGGLPMTVLVVRSSLNIAAGARNKLGAIFSGLLMLIAMLVAEPLMNRVPLATLAAILVFVGLQLVRPRIGWKPSVAVPYLVTIAAIIATNLLFGILIGLACAGVFALAGLYQTSNFEISADGRMTRIRLGEDVSFFHKAMLQSALDAVPDGRMVYIDGSRSLMVDEDIIDVIERYREQAKARGITVVVGGIGRISSYTEEHRAKMDEEYRQLILNNKSWVSERLKENPDFFNSTSEGQAPHFLFIGCSDSRVPAETITKTTPGSLFVHRNIANIVSLSDVNTLSVLQYSVDVLNVPHIIVCGHYGCGGVKAALSHKSFGLIDNWITPIKLTVQQHADELSAISDPHAYERRVIELHVTEQVRNIYKTSVVQNAIAKYGSPKVHGWVYDLKTGLINDLDIAPDVAKTLHPVYRFER